MSQLVTGEAVALDLPLAGVPSRTIAACIDFTLQITIFFVLMFLVGALGGSEATTAALVIVAILVPALGYPVTCETLMHGRTLGKMALGLRVVRDDGGPIVFRQAFVRGLLGMFVEKPGISFGSAAVISALASDRAKRCGDHLAGTMVVQERVVTPRSEPVQMPPQLAAWATSLDLSRLPDDLALTARGYLTRYPSLTPAAQADLGARISGQVAALVTPEPPPGVPAWAYLSAVLAERRRRAEQSQPPPPAYGVQSGYFTSPTAAAPATPPPPAPAVQEADSPFAPPA